MKKATIIFLIIILCITFSSCGEDDNITILEDFEAGAIDGEEYEFNISLTDDFELSPVFVITEYDNLLAFEDQFLNILKDAVNDVELGDYEFGDYKSIREDLKEQDPEYYEKSDLEKSVVVYADEEEGDEDLEYGSVSTGIRLSETKDYSYHYVDYSTREYESADSCDFEELTQQVAKLEGVIIDPKKLEEAFKTAEKETPNTDDLIDLEQIIIVKEDDHEDLVYCLVSGWYEDGDSGISLFVLRKRVYL